MRFERKLEDVCLNDVYVLHVTRASKRFVDRLVEIGADYGRRAVQTNLLRRSARSAPSIENDFVLDVTIL
jgi:hypothetical protein